MSEQRLFRTLQITFIAIIAAFLVPALVIFANGNRLHRKYWRAVSRLRDGEYRPAAQGLEECAARRPRDLDALWNVTIARFHLDDYDGAAQALEARHDLLGENKSDYGLTMLDYVKALAAGDQPVGFLSRVFVRQGRGGVPKAYWEARENLSHCRYSEAIALYEECLGQMPPVPGDMDALWGVAIARFHAGDLDRALEALKKIRAEWRKEPSEAFEAVVAYMKRCAPGESLPLGMPPVLRAYATHQERRRQLGSDKE